MLFGYRFLILISTTTIAVAKKVTTTITTSTTTTTTTTYAEPLPWILEESCFVSGESLHKVIVANPEQVIFKATIT